MRTVGACEAKTHPPRLLDEVARGESITITKNDTPVAVLVPPPGAHRPDRAAAIEELKRLRRGVRLDGLRIHDLIDEGRRYRVANRPDSPE